MHSQPRAVGRRRGIRRIRTADAAAGAVRELTRRVLRQPGALLVLILAMGTTACADGQAASAEVPPMATSGTARPSCNAVIDTSGSLANLSGVWTQERRELPALVVRHDCRVLRVFTFDIDGWDWKPILEIAIPTARAIEVSHVPAELGGAKNIKDAIEPKQRAAAAAAGRAP